MSDIEKLADAIEAYVRKVRGGVSFVEAERVAKACGVEWSGDRCICNSNDPNIVIWAGMSDAAVDACHRLIRSGRLEYRTTPPLTYLIDGGMLRFPVLKRLPAKPLKTERWLPVVFDLPKVKP